MVTLEWCLERTEGVTLVGLVVGAERSCRVQIENRLDGPVWPPRRHGHPADGWDDRTFTGCVPADGRLTVGYATPAAPSEPPAAVVSTEPASDGDDALRSDSVDDSGRADAVPSVEQSPAGVVRALGDPLIPRDSVPLSGGTGSQQESGPSSSEPTTPEDDHTDSNATTSAIERTKCAVDAARRDERERGSGTRDDCPSTANADRLLPRGVRHWLDDVEGRLDAIDCDDEPIQSEATEPESLLAAAREVDRFALRQVRRRIDSLLARTGGGQHCHECGSELPDRREDAVGPGKG